MARARDPNRDKAFEIYKQHDGKIPLKDIASKLGKGEGTVRGWKNKDDWEGQLNGTLQSNERNAPIKKQPNKSKKKVVESEEEIIFDAEGEDGLTDRQRLFCMYYIKTYNQTMAAIKAGYAKDSAHVEGSRLLRNAKVSNEIKRLKGEQRKGIFIDAMDVLDKYIQIAFADITDYLTFGRERVQLIGAFGPVNDDKGNPVMVDQDYVRFNESIDVDGTLITEVKQGRDGLSVKFADKMRALEFLTRHFDMLDEKTRKKLQEEKTKAEITKIKSETKGLNIAQASGVDLSKLTTEELRALAARNKR